jgi:hypothetical protein
MSELNSELEQIRNEWHILEYQWKDTCQYWHDIVQQRFDREFWQEYAKLLPAYTRKLEETSALIAKANRELNME